MKNSGAVSRTWCAVAGGAAGLVNGFFGGGGGMILVPLLSGKCGLDRQKAFATSVAIIAPLCALSAAIYWYRGALDFGAALPYLLGSGLGGVAAGIWGRKIPTKWLHRILGVLILWGGVRYLC